MIEEGSIDTLILFMREMKANLDQLGAIPFGWDYSCDKDVDGCKK